MECNINEVRFIVSVEGSFLHRVTHLNELLLKKGYVAGNTTTVDNYSTNDQVLPQFTEYEICGSDVIVYRS